LKIPKFAVGILYSLQIFFVNIFEPSSCEANLLGPKTFTRLSSKKLTIPSTRGFSGPTTTISIFSFLINFFSNLKLSIFNLIF